MGKHNLDVSWEEMVWAAITMGKPGLASLLSHGWHSVSEMVVRTHTVYANLCQFNDYMEQSSLYRALDPTEKGATSYFMGMLAAKVLSARLLDVPWLFHLSMLTSLGGYATLAANSEPDLIGLTSNWNWIVVEAKGRTGRYSAKAMSAAKLQTQQLRHINGQPPSLRVATQAFFNPRMEWVMEDPEEYDEIARDLNVDVQTALERYYSSAMAATEKSGARNIGNRKFIVRALPEIGVTIAIDADTRERIAQREVRPTNVGAHEYSLRRASEDNFIFFPDGLAISLDERWTSERMMLDPIHRRELTSQPT